MRTAATHTATIMSDSIQPRPPAAARPRTAPLRLLRLCPLAPVLILLLCPMPALAQPCENLDVQFIPDPNDPNICCWNLVLNNFSTIDIFRIVLTPTPPVEILSVNTDLAWNEFANLPTDVAWEPIGGGSFPLGVFFLADICFKTNGQSPQTIVLDFYTENAAGMLVLQCQQVVTLRCPVDGTVCGTKFEDLDADGIHDNGEPGLANWEIHVLDANNNLHTVFTDANGDYCVSNLPPGSTVVSEVQQTGWSQTAPTAGSYTVNLTAGQTLTGLDFGNVQSCVRIDKESIICDQPQLYTYNFDMTNLTQCPMAEVQFTVLSPPNVSISGATFTPILFGQTTTISVTISGSGAQAGAVVCFIVHVLGTPGTGPCCDFQWCVTLPDCPVTLCGTKWRDRNRNSVRNFNDNGLANWTIVLKDTAGNTIATTLTDANGDYCFDGFPPGTYIVCEVIPNGWVQTFPLSVTHTVTLTSGQSATGLDFGNARCAISGLSKSSFCVHGTIDNFAGPEPSFVSAPLLARLFNCSATTQPPQFDINPPPVDRCWGHTFVDCWDASCLVTAATVRIRMRASNDGLVGNDTISFVEDGVNVWRASIKDLPGAGGTWSSQTAIFTFDLANLPAVGGPITNILATLQDGDLGILVQDDTAVDWVRINVTMCCHKVIIVKPGPEGVVSKAVPDPNSIEQWPPSP